MERIKQAVELARANRKRLGEAVPDEPISRRQVPGTRARPEQYVGPTGARAVRLDENYLRSMRIVTQEEGNPDARGFEMLRSQLYRKMGEGKHQTIGITSPTAGCGKTVCALNLALSIARLPERSITLVDLDLRKPQVASYLGLPPGKGMEAVLRGEAGLDEISVVPEIGAWRFRVLPTYAASRNAAELIASTRMSEVVRQLRADDPEGIILFDLPPVLAVDDVISFLPHLDAILLVVASGESTVSDIANSERLIGSAQMMGIVLNKAEQTGDGSYSY